MRKSELTEYNNYNYYLTREYNLSRYLTVKIVINGETKEVDDKLTAQALLQSLGLAEKKLALEVNEAIVPRSELLEHVLQPGDHVEIIHAIGGG